MNRFKKVVALLTVTATLGASASAFSDQCCDDGYAYEGTCRASCISPLVALGAVGLVAGIFVAVNDNHHHHKSSNGVGDSSVGSISHSHSHSH